MGKKKFISGIAFVSIAMLTGGMVSIYEMNRGSVEVKGAAQMVTADTVQAENIKLARAEVKEAVQIDKATFSCGVSGCTQTEEHQHGLCGIDGCAQIGEHSHGVCNIAGCTETGAHMHDGEYCYAHSADDGHAYHNCGVPGCTEMESHTHNSCGVPGCTEVESHTHNSCGVSGCTDMGSHTHNSCGVSGCTQTGEHSHGERGRGHHRSGHGNGHH